MIIFVRDRLLLSRYQTNSDASPEASVVPNVALLRERGSPFFLPGSLRLHLRGTQQPSIWSIRRHHGCPAPPHPLRLPPRSGRIYLAFHFQSPLSQPTPIPRVPIRWFQNRLLLLRKASAILPISLDDKSLQMLRCVHPRSAIHRRNLVTSNRLSTIALLAFCTAKILSHQSA